MTTKRRKVQPGSSAPDAAPVNRGALAVCALQLLALACALTIGLWSGVRTAGVVFLALLGASAITAALAGSNRSNSLARIALRTAWVGSCALPAGLLLGNRHPSDLVDTNHSMVAWLMAAAVLLPGFRLQDPGLRKAWKTLGMVWLAGGAVFWLYDSHIRDAVGAFYLGVPLNVAWLVLCKRWFKLPWLAVQLINTLTLLVIGIPAVDLCVNPHYRLNQRAEFDSACYSFDSAKKDPAAFAHWWRYYGEHWEPFLRSIITAPRQPALPFSLRRGYDATLFESRIHINSAGFRGRDFPPDKGAAYRIVALGESTTFGVTLKPGDRPWPELLEQMIRERLKPQRSVEVINAGVPAYSIQESVTRLPAEILPLRPDLIISYHGLNGFRLLDRGLPPISGKPPPPYRDRPVKLLADCEYRLALMRYLRDRNLAVTIHDPNPPQVMNSHYGQAYRRLIGLAATNHIRLLLANYSMAVNTGSDPEVLGFYRTGFPSVYALVRANLAHSFLVRELGRQYPEVCLADSHPGLDGTHEKFIDLVHLTQEGRQQLAENLFPAVAKVLQADLAPVKPQ